MIHDHILNAVKVRCDLTTEAILNSYLQSLQEPVKALREAYRKFPVKVDYTNEANQIGYYITYFPHYTTILPYILYHHANEINTHNHDSHCLWLIGCGPCPELIGYLLFLKMKKPDKATKIQVLGIDISTHAWAYSRDMTLEHLVPEFIRSNTIERFAVTEADITTSCRVQMNTIPKIVVFQNCLNEATEIQHEIIIQNFRKIFEALPEESTIIIADLANYSAVVKLISKVEINLSALAGYKLIRPVSKGRINWESPFAKHPEVITTHLLTGSFWWQNGLIPKKHLKFEYCVIYKDKINKDVVNNS